MQPAQPSAFEMLLPTIAIGFVFLMVVRNIMGQSKKMKEIDAFQKNLKRGDQVVTTTGMVGTVDGLTEQFVTLEIAPSVKVRFLRKNIQTTVAAITASAAAPLATSEVKKV